MFSKSSDLFDPKGYFAALWPYRYTCFLFTHCNARSKKWRATYAIIFMLGHSAMYWYSLILSYPLKWIATNPAELVAWIFEVTVIPLNIVMWFFVGHRCFMGSVSSITRLDRDLANICSKHVDLKAMVRRQLICFVCEYTIYIPVTIVCILTNSVEPLNNLPYTVQYVSYHYIAAINNSVMSVFSNVVYFIGDRYALINSALEDTRDGDVKGEMTNHSNESENVVELIRQLRIVHRKLFSVSKEVMEGFSLQIVFCIVLIFFETAYDLYFLTFGMSAIICHESTTMDYLIAVFSVVHSLTGIVYMAYCCHRTVRMANGTAKILNTLIIDGNDMRLEVSSFFHQMIHCQLFFSPLGFFQVDLAFLQSFIASMATYFVILAQVGTVIFYCPELRKNDMLHAPVANFSS
ncbi:putative gustatory receptor 28b [Athalia rosae]|uniref:putative gustatory receptor 28b n=1 Tax=Athalia rosae TaxID=37344 RepID=UPI0020337351|nr:putative gustatory receptor 28b [Athalia rosae]